MKYTKLVLSLLYGATSIHGFVTPNTPKSFSIRSSSSLEMSKNVVVISPPGGIGEVTAVESAKLGASVRWFVIGADRKITFSEESLSSISNNGGSVEFAGSDAEALLLSKEDPKSALMAVSSWCGASDAVISCMDSSDSSLEYDEKIELEDAIKVATKEACMKCVRGGTKVAISSIANYEVENSDVSNDEGGNPLGALTSLLGGSKVEVPATLVDAMGASAIKLRHGELFGTPESSVDASPFVGGPRRDPILRDEYTNRAIRLDSSVAIYSNPVIQSKTKSSRLSMGEAASLLALNMISSKQDLDVCLASLRGSEKLTQENWSTEFTRLQTSPSTSTTNLFSTTFGSTPNKDRLVDWLATKWAPAILRTYDIAGIRVGARPVYASRTEDTVQIVWQELINFEPKTVGKLSIQIVEKDNEIEMMAQRGAGDARQGFGKVSLKPLAGEDVILRSLSDAAAQAIEKGLATKPTKVKAEKPKKKDPVSTVQASTTVASSGSVEAAAPSPAELESGPRSAGARRSARSRGKRRKQPLDSDDDSSAPPEGAFE